MIIKFFNDIVEKKSDNIKLIILYFFIVVITVGILLSFYYRQKNIYNDEILFLRKQINDLTQSPVEFV